MEKSYLEKTEEKFYSSLEKINNAEERFQRYSDFWHWLVQEDDDTKEVQARLIYNVVKWLISTGAIVKNFTANWNRGLVKRTGEYIIKFKEITEMGEKDIIEQTSLFHKIINEPDFATMAYCCQMLQRDGVVNFGELYKKQPEKIIVTEPTLLEDDK